MTGGTGRRRVLVHASGFRQSPYADIRPVGGDVRDTRSMVEGSSAGAVGAAGAAGAADAGPPEDEDAERRARAQAPRKLWHSSPGSAGR